MKGIITSDLDGTLLPEDGTFLPQTHCDEIARLADEGWLFCPASGRQYASLRRIFAPVADRLAFICENGAVVFSPQGKVLNKVVMPRREVEELYRDLYAIPGCEVLLSGEDMSYVNPKGDVIVPLLRDVKGNTLKYISGVEDIPEDVVKLAAWLPQGASAFPKALEEKWQKFHPAVSGACWVDFNLSDKGVGLQALCRTYGVELKDTVAFGDNFNDAPILALAGRPYIMSTANPILLDRFPNHCDDVLAVLRTL